jgi:uncharacterized protein with PIN domain
MIVDASALICVINREPGETLPFTDAHSRLALGAYSRFGKGRHPAALNLVMVPPR